MLLLPWRPDRTSTSGGIGWDASIHNPNVYQRLHRLQILVGEETKQLGHGDEVYEAGIEVGPPATGRVGVVDVPKGIDPVRVIDVGVDPEYLPEDGLAVCEEVLREACRFAHPIVARESR